MTETEIKEKIQSIFDAEFSKILHVQFDKQDYRIAIRQEHVPKLKSIDFKNEGAILKFKENLIIEDSIKNFEILKDRIGELSAILIPNIEELNRKNVRIRINRDLSNSLKSITAITKDEVLDKHREKRIAHAISKMLESVNP
jgi:hypothetical protein